MGTNYDENTAAPQLSKEPGGMTESNGEPWRSRIALRLKPAEVLYLRLPRYKQVASSARSTFCIAPSEQKPILLPIERTN
jgi:hypothetical protein